MLVTTGGAAASPAAAAAPETDGPARGPGSPASSAFDRLVPAPASVRPGGEPYRIGPGTAIRVDDSPASRRIGEHLASVLRPSTGYALPVTTRQGKGGITLKLGAARQSGGGPGGASADGAGETAAAGGAEDGKGPGSGTGAAAGGDGTAAAESYRLHSAPGGVTVTAPRHAGLFRGVQTLRQLLPAAAEADTRQPGPWTVPGGTVTDAPRFTHRGAMLDVSRHFFTVEQVKRYIDQLALYKINKLHLHLSDDQGWRIAIDSWPRLATHGGSTEVGGGPGGHYTKDDYREIVSYAAERYLEVIPEIDMPGHTNAALSSYAELNCDGVAPPLYTGIEVGFSSLCADKEITYDFVDDVVRELAELTPGRYLHIGGDEAHATSHEDYARFMDRAQEIVGRYGKTVVGWHQITGARPVEGAVAQYWGTSGDDEQVAAAARAGTKIVLSPANRAYLDMKYDEDTPLGLSWAGYVQPEQSYSWDPGSYLRGAPESAILGVEAPLWSETLETGDDIEFMAFPRLPGIAELGWSPADALDWADYRQRIATHGPRWEALGINYHRSPQIPWE
ncbi:family 20 glycosylhydrolase [Streptomyces sp. PLAI1-29]|uniref:beta-N-acetylhexosaminidase n=1 Tax=Streptomyces zingiberis TaxID=2053010 RepID=A0ABX1BXV2_9ACTN|nr:family 20 glycosylhydrolase [Streptomyces zingiberis]